MSELLFSIWLGAVEPPNGDSLCSQYNNNTHRSIGFGFRSTHTSSQGRANQMTLPVILINNNNLESTSGVDTSADVVTGHWWKCYVQLKAYLMRVALFSLWNSRMEIENGLKWSKYWKSISSSSRVVRICSMPKIHFRSDDEHKWFM